MGLFPGTKEHAASYLCVDNFNLYYITQRMKTELSPTATLVVALGQEWLASYTKVWKRFLKEAEETTNPSFEMGASFKAFAAAARIKVAKQLIDFASRDGSMWSLEQHKRKVDKEIHRMAGWPMRSPDVPSTLLYQCTLEAWAALRLELDTLDSAG